MSRKERKEREIRDARELCFVFIFGMLVTAFVLGLYIGKENAVHNCYMVSETETQYVLNFNGTEHLYLRGK